jgi:hypothetical protein
MHFSLVLDETLEHHNRVARDQLGDQLQRVVGLDAARRGVDLRDQAI